MRKQSILIEGQSILVASDLLAKDENGLEYPQDCYKLEDGNYVLDTDALALKDIENQVTEYKAYLDKTDFKFYNGYVPKEDEDLVALQAERDLAREFIRSNNG